MVELLYIEEFNYYVNPEQIRHVTVYSDEEDDDYEFLPERKVWLGLVKKPAGFYLKDHAWGRMPYYEDQPLETERHIRICFKNGDTFRLLPSSEQTTYQVLKDIAKRVFGPLVKNNEENSAIMG